jgi:hypothetical protein
MTRVSMESTWHAAATDLQLSRCQRKMTRVSMDSTWHAAATDLHTVKESEKDEPGSAWSSTWHAAATDLHPVNESEKDDQGQHGVHLACSSHRLTSCQGVRER